jgi:plastocyanin
MQILRRNLLLPVVLILAASVLLVACGGYGSSSYPAPNTTITTVQVVSCASVTADQTVVANGTSSFVASAVSISVNQIVRWDNSSGFAHTVTSTSVPLYGAFNAPLPSPGSVCLKFTSAGTFHYQCSIHTGMTGTVTVN